MNARLEIARADVSPKCANCGWWHGRETDITAALCNQHEIVTLDLSVCSGWRDGDVQIEILTGDQE